MSSSEVTTIYMRAVDDVVDNVRELYVKELGEDAVLSKLQEVCDFFFHIEFLRRLLLSAASNFRIWELKLMLAGIAIQRNYTTDGEGIPILVHDLNIPSEQTTSQTPIQTPLPVQDECFHADQGDNGSNLDIAEDTPPLMDFSLMASGKRKWEEYFVQHEYVPQQDGSGDISLDCTLHQKFGATAVTKLHGNVKGAESTDASLLTMTEVIHSEDSKPSSYDPIFSTDVGTAKSSKREDRNDDEPPLNEDDDDDDLDDMEQSEKESTVKNLVLAQFETVKRIKCKWKCVLKAGIMHLDDRDILFTKCILEGNLWRGEIEKQILEGFIAA